MTDSSAAWLLVLCSSMLFGCEDTETARFENGPATVEFSAGDWELPSELREDTDEGPRVTELACNNDDCPTFAQVVLTCEDATCDPGPISSTAFLGSAVDFGSAATVMMNDVRRFDVERFDYEVELNTLTVPVSGFEIFWGPDGTVEVDPSRGVTLLAELPPLGPRAVRAGQVTVDPSRQDALSHYLVETEPRVRFLVRATIDLAPGQPYPEGSVRLGLTMLGAAEVLVND